MSTLHIIRTHRLTVPQARQVAEQLADDLQSEYGLQYAWSNDVLEFHTFGVTGDLHVHEEEIVLQAQLSLFVMAFKTQLEQAIHQHFDKHFVEIEAQLESGKTSDIVA